MKIHGPHKIQLAVYFKIFHLLIFTFSSALLLPTKLHNSTCIYISLLFYIVPKMEEISSILSLQP